MSTQQQHPYFPTVEKAHVLSSSNVVVLASAIFLNLEEIVVRIILF